MLLAAGSYMVRVSAPDIAELRHDGGYSGRYDLYAYTLNSAPEHADAALSVGDVIEDEALDPVGDVDTFILDGHRGDDVNIFLFGSDERWPQNMTLFLGYSDGRGGPLGLAYSAEQTKPAPSTGHIVLPEDGQYPVIIGPTNQGADGAESGPYRLVVQRVSRAVEQHVAEITVGDTVSDERLDDPDDVDEFTLSGVPGQLVAASVTADPSTMGVRLEAVDPTTRETLAFTTSTPDRATGVTAPFKLDASGAAAVRIYRATDVVPGDVGGYDFEVHSFNPEPEAVAAAIAIGDTVRGEAVERLGDVDEYTFSGAAGDKLVAYSSVVSSPDPEWPLKLEVLDGEREQVLVSMQIVAGIELGDVRSETFSISESGTYIVRVSGFDNEHGSGEYTFTLQPAP
jgi:hypothetical protein